MASFAAVDDDDRAYERHVDVGLAGGLDVDDDLFWSFADEHQRPVVGSIGALWLGVALGAIGWALIGLLAWAIAAALT